MRTKKLLIAAATLAACIPSGLKAQSWTDNLQIHGYVNQALARSFSRSLPIFGITDTTSGDYRRVGVQFRYEISPKDQVVFQVGNSRMGESALTAGQRSAVVEYAFVNHDFGPFSLRAGRFPAQQGIYNEIRAVGTLLPFFRAPGMFYMEGKESYDGISANTSVFIGKWRLEPSLIYGTMPVKYILYTPDPKLMDTACQGDLTGWLWLSTPVDGVRFGYGFDSWKKKGLDLSAPMQHFWYQHAAVDASFEKVYLRAEGRKVHTKFDEQAGYVQAGAEVLPKLWLNGQGEWLKNTVHVPNGPTNIQNNRDLAAGFDYKVSPNYSLKLEGHTANGKQFEKVMTAPGHAYYAIASVAATF